MEEISSPLLVALTRPSMLTLGGMLENASTAEYVLREGTLIIQLLILVIIGELTM